MTAPPPLLYTYRRCPYAMRARMALLVANVAFDAIEIVLRDKPPAMLAASPKGTVPVLCLPYGRVIDESRDIMAWALRDDPHQWWSCAQTPENRTWLASNDDQFKHDLDRYKYPERFAADAQGSDTTTDIADQRAHHRDRAMQLHLQPLDDTLRKHRYLGGEQPCATDLALFPFVRQFAAVDAAWFDARPLPSLQAWLRTWVDSPLFRICMQRLKANERTPFWRGDSAFIDDPIRQ